MWFPTFAKVRLRYEEFLVRLEMIDASVSQSVKSANLENSLFGDLPEFQQFKERCARVHGILIGAVDGLFNGAVTPRHLAKRIPQIEDEVHGLELVADRIRHSLDALKAA